MPPKRPATSPAMSSTVAKKTRKSLILKVKQDIIHRHERGEKTNSIAHHHRLTPSTVSTFFKSTDSIKKAGETVSFLQAKRTTQTRDSAMDKMESLVEMRYIRFVCDTMMRLLFTFHRLPASVFPAPLSLPIKLFTYVH
ncbi:CENPB DNA-binding domain-containing protein 1 [Portunus trituberculatus]|uniref:CENPB DNA-binding domain-containing protein 1 n=1 Tax=Portunus trituberculatus TaxID=210409 RepID=A0A5B7GDD8_PORTR|nr:CENPB DNA-binding domain-containing protein 1 [Portunus trituberculatus]